MDSLALPLVQTKIRPPAVRPQAVERPLLLEQLCRADCPRVVLVCAPAGYGKTTLLAQWARALENAGTAAAWLSLDPADSEPVSFLLYLLTSLERALGPDRGLAELAQGLRAAPAGDPARVLPGLINALAAHPRPCLLVLDDYHLVGSPAVHALLASLLERLPETLRVAIGSRAAPPLRLARLRARGELLELRAPALRFSPEEAARFLNETLRLELSPEAVRRLAARTEGWAAGLQLAGLSVAGRPEPEQYLAGFSGSQRYLAEYLLEDVLDRQPEELQSFLYYTSVLERLSAGLCDALLGTPTGTGAALLRRLEQANLFLTALDEEGQWYRYHPLFRDFLRGLLEQTQPEQVSALHRAACGWLAESGSLREAAYHAFQAQDPEYAAGFVEQHCFTLITHSELNTLNEWCGQLPEAVFQTHPTLAIVQCWPWVFQFSAQDRPRIEQRLAQAEAAIAALGPTPAAEGLREHAAVVRSFLTLAPDPSADPLAGLANAQANPDLHAPAPSSRLSAWLGLGYAQMAAQQVDGAAASLEQAYAAAAEGQLFFGMAETAFHLAWLALAVGEPERALAICDRADREIDLLRGTPARLPAQGCLDTARGMVWLDQGCLERAESALLRGLELAGLSLIPYSLMMAQLGLYRLRRAQGRGAETLAALASLAEGWPAAALLPRGLELAQGLGSPASGRGVTAAARAWAGRFPAEICLAERLPGLGPFGGAEVYYQASLAWARILIVDGRPRAALPYLSAQRAKAKAGGLVRRVIELSLLESLARAALGRPEEAQAARRRAEETAADSGMIGLLDAAPAPEGQTGGLIEPLSPREIELLRLLAAGASNQEIAGRLFITVGTVKSHVNHILRKLDARNRTEAVARARALEAIRE